MPHDQSVHRDGQPLPGIPRQLPADARRGSEGGVHAADLPVVSGRGVALITLVVVVLFGALFMLGWMPQSRRLAQAATEATERADAKPVVAVIVPQTTSATVDLTLPGDVGANQSTAIYARTSGYLKALPDGIDIGARVKAGQVIAEIAAPEVDADLEQTRATLDQTRASVVHATDVYNFQKSSFDRYEAFAATGGLTTQQLDDYRQQYNTASTALHVAEANAASAAAAVKRLQELQGFQKVVAPFSGVITARGYDAGALISGTPGGTGPELFRVEDTDVLRVYVNIPQGDATDVQPGQDAELLVPNFPGQAFKGTVARSAGAINPATRTMKTEVDVPNADGRLLPGMYGQIRFHLHRAHPALLVPTGTLVFGSDGMRVAVVEAGRVRFKQVSIGRDFGAEAEIESGLTSGEQVVNNPGESLTDGTEVAVMSPAGPPAAATKEPKP